METRFYGKYRGFVVQNNDPEKRGLVKVWVPTVCATIYDDWQSLSSGGTDHEFIFLGENVSEEIMPVVDRLKQILPWAEVNFPIIGAGTAGYYNAGTNQARVGDGAVENNGDSFDQYIEDGGDDKTRQPAGSLYDNPETDAFSTTKGANNVQPNPYGIYRAHQYSNTAKGGFTTIGVGAHVWVFFEEGDPLYPVVDGYIFGAKDFKGVYQEPALDYPTDFENDGESESPEKDVLRHKYLINERGGSLEIVSTTGRERVKMTHFGGSFYEMQSHVYSRLAAANDQSLVLGDQFNTVRGNRNSHVGGHSDSTILGDSFEKHGDVVSWSEPYSKIKPALQRVQEIKNLFPIKRTDYTIQSSMQTQDGEYAPCPVCSQGVELNQIGGDIPLDRLTNGSVDGCVVTPSVLSPIEDAMQAKSGDNGQIFGAVCWCCGGSGKSPASQDGTWASEDLKETLTDEYVDAAKQVREFEAALGSSSVPSGGNHQQIVSLNKTTVVGLDFNDLPSFRKDPKGKLVPHSLKVNPEGCYVSRVTSPLVEVVDVESLPGGDWDIVVGQKYTLTVGSGGAKIQTTGALSLGGAITDITGELVAVHSNTEVTIEGRERVNIEGKTITLRPRVHRGINETHDGTIGDGSGDFDDASVLIDGNLGVSHNLMVLGGAYINGELMFHHLTAPMEFHLTDTEPGTTRGALVSGVIIGQVVSVSGVPMVMSVCAPSAIEVEPHIHWTRGPAMTLMETHNDVREAAARANGVSVVLSHGIMDSDPIIGGRSIMPVKNKGLKQNPGAPPFGDSQFAKRTPLPTGVGESTETTQAIINNSPLVEALQA